MQNLLGYAIAAQVSMGMENPNAIPPKDIEHILEHGLTREELLEFTARNLKFLDEDAPKYIGGLDADWQAKMQSMFARIISDLPPWQQAALIPLDRPIIIGSADSVNNEFNELSPEKSIVNGFFTYDKNAIYVSYQSNDIGQTTTHEKGHQIGKNLGGRKDYADISPKWKEALAREIENGFSGEENLDSLKIRVRKIDTHLHLDYKESEYCGEALAQITAVYNKVYVHFGKDVEKNK